VQQRPDERVPATAQVRADPVAGAVARISLQPVDGVHVTTLIDNSSDVLLPDEGLVRRWGLAGTAGPLPIIPGGMAGEGRTVDFLRAEHGFSALVEVHAGGRTRRVLFDAGGTPDGLTANLDRLALSPDTFEAIVFSHGHFDHVMGLDGLAHRLGPRNLPVLIHPDFWTRRRVATPNGALELPTPSRAAIEGAGFTIVEDRHPSFLLDGMLLVTGEVDRTTDFETGMPAAHQAWRNGGWQADRLVHDDQAIVLHVQEKGLVVLTGCGHAGIVNIVRHAKRLTSVARVYAVLGGFHLRDGPTVPQSVAALAAEAPAVVVPAHCTSWKAQHALAAELPTAFHPNAVGSRFQL
jgi:7,8-dihydropterin-6-yl-methyl-4-(beta-D-ribofuranosyl)aminobenzene 5'-phosphate synthase